MNNARRRMIVQKYRNRPPFDLKKKEAVNKHFRKSFQHVEQSFKTIMDHLDAIQSEYDVDILINHEDKPNKQVILQPKTNNIAPKIIESFKKATPKMIQSYKNPKRFQCKKLSLIKDPTKSKAREDLPVETLYRNENLTFGKNIPDHKLMKNLLDDLNTSTINIRVDKSTSTTGIIWPVPPPPPLYVKNKVRHNHKDKSKIPMRRKGKMTHSPETVPEGRRLKCNASSFIGSKSSVCRKTEGTFIVGNKTNKENSFVRSQIESFNKLLPKKSNRPRPGVVKLKNNSKNYLGMMNSVKNNFPKMEPKTEISISENHDWSSTTEKIPKRPDDIKFPRETKDAVELMIQDSRRFLKTPLAKYLKYQDALFIQPAISMNHMSEFQNKSQYTPCKKVVSNPEPTENRFRATKDVSGWNIKKSCTQKPKVPR